MTLIPFGFLHQKRDISSSSIARMWEVQFASATCMRTHPCNISHNHNTMWSSATWYILLHQGSFIRLPTYATVPLKKQPANSVQHCNIFYKSLTSGPQTACTLQHMGNHHACCPKELDHCTDLFMTPHSEKINHFHMMPSLPPCTSCTLYISHNLGRAFKCVWSLPHCM